MSYYYYNLAGVTFSLFDIAGSRDPRLYAPDPVDGSRTGSPNTLGGFVQLNVLPFSQWFDLKWPALPMTQLALQYTFYAKFNGAAIELRRLRSQCLGQQHALPARLDAVVTEGDEGCDRFDWRSC